MKILCSKSIIVFALTFGLSALLFADETFISFTRQATPINGLPANVSVLTKEDIVNSGAITIDQVLDLLPSVIMNRSGFLGSFTTIRMRGVTTTGQVQIIVDDQPLGGIAQQFVDLSQIPVENIDRIEVVRGGASVLYGANTIGGVVHIFTKRPQPESPEIEVRGEGGSHQTRVGSLQAGAKVGSIDGYAFIKNYQTDGFQDNAKANNWSGLTTVGYTSSTGKNLVATVSAVDHKIGDPKGTPIPLSDWDGKKERQAVDRDARTEKTKNEVRLRGETPVSDLGLIRAQLFGFHDNFQDFADDGSIAIFEQTNNIYGGDARFQSYGGFSLGASYERDEQETVGSADTHITNWGLYSVLDIREKQWALIPGVRFDQHSQFGNIINPRLTILAAVLPSWIVSANASRSFRAPNFLELFYKSSDFNGNPNLRPETAWTYDFGNEFRISRHRTAKLTGYYSRIRERIVASSETYRNLHHAELMGVEFEMTGRLGPFKDTLTYSYTRAKGNSTTNADYVNLRLTPPHMVNAVLVWEGNHGISVSNTIQYVARQFQFDNDSGEKLPSYGLWDIRVGKNIFGSSEIYGRVDNITNKRYAQAFGIYPNTYIPAPDRTYWVGVNIKLSSPAQK